MTTTLIAKEKFFYNGRNVEQDEAFEAEDIDVPILTHHHTPKAMKESPPEGEVPNPSLNSINPSSAREDAGPVTFNATGTRFYPGSRLSFGGDFIPTQFVDTGKLIGSIDTTHFGDGNYLVHVDNDGSLSISKTFTITATGVKNAGRGYKRRDMKAEG